jgi:hypothetical protein
VSYKESEKKPSLSQYVCVLSRLKVVVVRFMRKQQQAYSLLMCMRLMQHVRTEDTAHSSEEHAHARFFSTPDHNRTQSHHHDMSIYHPVAARAT